jgi:hypothetical protein
MKWATKRDRKICKKLWIEWKHWKKQDTVINNKCRRLKKRNNNVASRLKTITKGKFWIKFKFYYINPNNRQWENINYIFSDKVLKNYDTRIKTKTI